MKKKLLAVVLCVFCSFGLVFANEGSTETPAVQGNQINNQNVVVNVNLNDIYGGAQISLANTHAFGLGITTPIYGTYHNVWIDGKEYTKKLTGINWALGYTWRNYTGNGLPKTKGGAFYYEFYTLALIVPFAGFGYDYRFNESVLIGFGFPDLIHGSIAF